MHVLTILCLGTGFPGKSDSRFDSPISIGFDGFQNLYVVDGNNNRVQRFDLIDNGC